MSLKRAEGEQMENLKKIWEKMEEYAKDTLGDNADDFLSKTYLRGYSEYKDHVLSTNADNAWKGLTEPAKGYESINQLGYALNPLDAKHKTVVVMRNGITRAYDRQTGQEFPITEDNYINGMANDETQKNIGAFPRSHTWKNGREVKLPNPGRRVTEPIFRTFLRAGIHDAKQMKNGTEVPTKVMIGSADNRVKWFHLMYSTNIRDIMYPLIQPGPVKAYEAAVDEAIGKYAQGTEVKGTWVEPTDFKKNIARAIALTEEVPFVAMYAPVALLAQKVYRDAIDRGLAKMENVWSIDWNYPVNFQVGEKKWADMPYVEGINTSKMQSFAKEGSVTFDKFLHGLKIKELTEEDIADKLAQAREDVKKAFEREIPSEWEASGGANEYISPFGTSNSGTKAAGKAEKVEIKENVKPEENFDDFDGELDDDEFPF